MDLVAHVLNIAALGVFVCAIYRSGEGYPITRLVLLGWALFAAAQGLRA